VTNGAPAPYTAVMKSAPALVLVVVAAVAGAGCTSSHAKGGPSTRAAPLPNSRIEVSSDVNAARASNPRLFSLFPRVPGEVPCTIPAIEGMHESKLAGTCRTSVAHSVTHGRYAETFVTFRESWGRRYSSWTLIVQRPAEKVVATQLHGSVAPQLRYATDSAGTG
jgi:hypothetical protein